jgi:sugar diacid utilization regulator
MPVGMKPESSSHGNCVPETKEAAQGLASLSAVSFDHLDADAIFATATAAMPTLAPCRVEASYRSADGEFIRCPPAQPDRPDLLSLARQSGCDGDLQMPRLGWVHAFALRGNDDVQGCVIVSADAPPAPTQILLLTLLVQHAAAALASTELHARSTEWARQLTDANLRLSSAVLRLRAQSNVHEVIGAVVSAGAGEQGIADALHELTSLPVALEDRFGNLRCWSGPGRPPRYPKPDFQRRERLLAVLAARNGPLRVKDRMVILVKPRTEILGVLGLVDPRLQVTNDETFALQYASTVLGMELSHQRHLAEMELGVRREFVDDLIAGTAGEGANARSAALGHDLRGPHYVVVMQSGGRADNALALAAGRAATSIHLNYLQGRHAGLVVLLTDDRPDPRAVHQAVTRYLGRANVVIGIGSRCDTPSGIPESFAQAQRSLNIRLHSAVPQGASAYDELGFYRLVDAAHQAGTVEDFVEEWLGALIEYDRNKNSKLVDTLSDYLECGGSYDESAAALHIHRSTLRYRLARIGELTGHDLRDVNTRFNLQAATRAWRFLDPTP